MSSLPPTHNGTGARVSAHRNFYDQSMEDQPEATNTTTNVTSSTLLPSTPSLFHYIYENIIGLNTTLNSPFGTRRIVYADWTASGRALKFIEDYINDEILSVYANTHTNTSFTGLQTSLFRREARDIIKRSVKASKDDVVLFAGSGCTGVLQLLLHILNLKNNNSEESSTKPLIFVGPYEHHTNILPWRECGAEMVYIKEVKRTERQNTRRFFSV